MTIRVVLADDHPVVRGGLRALLETIDGFEVVGEAVDGEGAVREAQLLRPDVVLMDIRMPGARRRRGHPAGPRGARRRRRCWCSRCTTTTPPCFTAMQAGARGYLLKGAEQEEIVGAIRAVAAGQAIFGPGHRLPGARLLRRAAGPTRPTSRSRS